MSHLKKRPVQESIKKGMVIPDDTGVHAKRGKSKELGELISRIPIDNSRKKKENIRKPAYIDSDAISQNGYKPVPVLKTIDPPALPSNPGARVGGITHESKSLLPSEKGNLRRHCK